MKKFFKSALVVSICLIMLMGTIAIGGNGLNEVMETFILKASAEETYSVGDYIYYGTYPQTDVTDELGDILNELPGTWVSYNYYSGTGTLGDGQMAAFDYMYYKDVVYNGDKYRAVTFNSYRPIYTGYTTLADNSYQDDNGYTLGNIYWFKFEPIRWRILDPSTGMVMSETILDSQPYNNYILSSGNSEYDDIAYWGDSAKTYYANNYENSSIRQWLNEDFYNTAFSENEKSNIVATTLDNSAWSTENSAYDSASTTDKVFLLSLENILNSKYGFSSDEENDEAHILQNSDYAKIQGLYVNSDSDGNYGVSSVYTLSTGEIFDIKAWADNKYSSKSNSVTMTVTNNLADGYIRCFGTSYYTNGNCVYSFYTGYGESSSYYNMPLVPGATYTIRFNISETATSNQGGQFFFFMLDENYKFCYLTEKNGFRRQFNSNLPLGNNITDEVREENPGSYFLAHDQGTIDDDGTYTYTFTVPKVTNTKSDGTGSASTPKYCQVRFGTCRQDRSGACKFSNISIKRYGGGNFVQDVNHFEYVADNSLDNKDEYFYNVVATPLTTMAQWEAIGEDTAIYTKETNADGEVYYEYLATKENGVIIDVDINKLYNVENPYYYLLDYNRQPTITIEGISAGVPIILPIRDEQHTYISVAKRDMVTNAYGELVDNGPAYMNVPTGDGFFDCDSISTSAGGNRYPGWRLRTSGNTSNTVCMVDTSGNINVFSNTSFTSAGVVTALTLNELKSSVEGSGFDERCNHTAVIDKEVPATCTEPGLTEGSHCSVCNKILVEQNNIPATGHNEAKAVKENEVSPSCETAGSYDSVVYCSICNAELTRETVNVIAHGHYFSEKIILSDANCTMPEKYTLICTVCGCEETDDNGEKIIHDGKPATGHNFTNEVVVREATCTEPEKVIFKCVNCGLPKAKNGQAATIEVVDCDPSTYPETPHNYENSKTYNYSFSYPGACSLTLNFSSQCEFEIGCDYLYLYDGAGNEIGCYSGNELSSATIEVVGDSFSIKVTTDGSVTRYGFSFDSIVAHNYENVKIYEGDYGIHKYIETYINPTCTEQGFDGLACKYCDDKQEGTVIPALGHNADYYLLADDKETEALHCSRCNEIVNTDKKIAYTENLENIVWRYVKLSQFDARDLPFDLDSDTTYCIVENKSQYFDNIDYKTITIPETIGDIPVIQAQIYSDNISVLNTPSSILYITVYNCLNLEKINLPKKYFEYYFIENYNSPLISCPKAVYYCEENGCGQDWCIENGYKYVLTNSDAGTDYVLKNNVIKEYKGTATDILIPACATTIGYGAFDSNNTIESVEIPYCISQIFGEAFANCENLEKVIIPFTVTSIAKDAFANTNAKICCYYNSYAYKYAVANNIPYELIKVTFAEENLVVGKSLTANIQAKPTVNLASGIPMVFKSSNPDVVAVDAEGNVTGVSLGKATISVYTDSNVLLGETDVTVKDINTVTIDKDVTIKGDYLTWTVITADDVTDIKLSGSYEINGAKKTISVIYKNTSTNANLKVTDEDGVRTWVIKQRFTYTGDVDSVTENYVAYYKTANSTSYTALNKDKPVTVTVYASSNVAPQETEKYLPYTLISAVGPTSAKSGSRSDVTIVTTDDCTKVRIGYMTEAGTMKYTTYQTTTTSNVSYTDANGLRTWTISYKFTDATNYSVNARGSAWGAEKTFTV